MKRISLLAITAISLSLVLGSCSKKDENGISVKQKEYILSYEEEAQIEAKSNLDIIYTSASDYVAKVSSSGLITAGRVGKTTIHLSNGESQEEVTIAVNPIYNLFPEPIDKVSFGNSKQKVKQIFGTPDYETSDGIVYDNHHLNYDYIFLLENDKITSMAVTIPILSMPATLSKFLLERYEIAMVEGYTAGFLNEGQNMAVAATPSDDLSSMFVMYFPYTPNRSTRLITPKDELLNAFQALSLRE